MTELKQIIIIISFAVLLGFSRSFFVEDSEFTIIKQARIVEEISSFSIPDDISGPMVVNLEFSKYHFDANSAIFIDARDPESFTEQHIKGAINLPYDYIDDIVNKYDLKFLLELNKNFKESIFIENNDPFIFGFKNNNIFITTNPDFNLDNDKIKEYETAFLIYCSGEGCSLSEDLGFYFFDELNIKKIFIYEGGIPEWLENNFPIDLK